MHREVREDRVGREVREVLAVPSGRRVRRGLPYPWDRQGQGDQVEEVVVGVVVVEEVEEVVVVEAHNIPLYMTGHMIRDIRADTG